MIIGTESRLVDELDGRAFNLDISTEVTVLNETAFIARYAGILGMGDYVMIGSTGSRVNDQYVDIKLAWTVDPVDRRKCMTEFAQKVNTEAADQMTIRMGPIREPMSAKEVQAVTDVMIESREKNKQYNQLSCWQKIGQNIRLMAGRDTLVTPVAPREFHNIPDIIVVNRFRYMAEEIIVNPESEARFHESRQS